MEEEVKTEQIEQNPDLIAKANEAAERIEKGNKEYAALVARQEKLKVEQILSGTAQAGRQEKSESEKQAEEIKKLLEGTGYEDVYFPPE